MIRVGEESFLRQVARQIEEARAMKPSVLQLTDVVLRYYVPGVVVFGGLAFLTWSLGTWVVTGQVNATRAIFATLAVFVMGYPCALGMATPLAMLRGGGEAAEKGILMRSGEAFQVFKDIRKIIFDKTGTLTEGEPHVVEVVPLEGTSGDDLLRWASTAEVFSEHALARAIVERSLDEGLDLPEAAGFEAEPGKGVRAHVEGRSVLVGSLRFLKESEVGLQPAQAHAEELEKQGKTVVGVAVEGVMAGLIAIADRLKSDAREAIELLRSAGIDPVLITGDNWRTAHAVAHELGIEQVLAEVLPEEKATEVRNLQDQGLRGGHGRRRH